MRRWMLLVALALALPARAAVQATDDAGRIVTLAKPAARIVALAPHLAELVYAAGAGDRLVGAVEWSDFPDGARRVPRVGDFAQLDLERIAALRPDLVLVWGSGNPSRQVERLAKLGLPIYTSESRDFAGIAGTLRRLGVLAGTPGAAEARAAAFERAIAGLRARYAGRRPVSVFFQIWPRPLMTVNGRHLISQTLALCGGRNVFASLDALAPTISEEAVVAADPDAIVSGSVDAEGRDHLDAWRRLPALRAVKLGNLFAVNPDLMQRQSDRIADGAAELCAKLDAARERLR